ncbi:MAG: serine/threonine-protein kinase [bacterium]
MDPNQTALAPRGSSSLIGVSIGNYQVLSLLGQGAMGEVYLGEHPQIGRRVAIKVLVDSLAGNQAMAQRFMSEARAVNKINHPNIIQIYDFGQLPDGRLYYTMEYLEGRELKLILQERAPLSIQSTADVLRQIAAALQAAHGHGIVHRDLKPENIFVVEHESGFLVKVLDFGIAKLLEPGMGSSHRTSTGMIMGTPLYMSPEQAAGDVAAISAQSDIYALGVITYQMLSGRLPIDAPTTAQILAMHITEPPRPLAQVAVGIPNEVAMVVEGSLQKDPALRPSSAQVFYEDFARACMGAAPGTVAIPLHLPGQSMAGTSSQSGISSAGDQPTTMSNSASQIMTESGARSGTSKGLIALLAVVLVLAAGLVGFTLYSMKGEKKGKTTTAAKTPPPMDVTKPVMERPALPAMPAALQVFKVLVKSKTSRVRVEVSIGGQKPFNKRPDFSLDVKSGERVTLRATRAGYEEKVESFLATADRTVAFTLDRRRHGARRPPMVMRPRPRPVVVQPRPRGMGSVGEGTLKPMF